MIRINLARKGGSGKPASSSGGDSEFTAEIKDIQKQGGTKLALALVIPAALYAYEYINIPELSGKLRSRSSYLDQLKQKNNEAKAAVEEIKQYKADKERLQKQIDTIDNLKKDRLTNVKILDTIQREIPEKVWLTKVDFKWDEKGDSEKVSLTGLAIADSDITLFHENLSKSVFLRRVEFGGSRDETSNGSRYKRFEISASVERDVKTQGGGGT